MFANLTDFDKFRKSRGKSLNIIEQDFPYIEYSLCDPSNILANNIKAKSIEFLSELLSESPRPFLYEILTPTEDVRIFLVFSHLYDEAFETLSIEDYKEEDKDGERQRAKVAETIKMFLMQQPENDREILFYSYKGEKSILYRKLQDIKIAKKITILEGPTFFEKVAKCPFVESRKEKLSRIIKTAFMHTFFASVLYLAIHMALAMLLASAEKEYSAISVEVTAQQKEKKEADEELLKLQKKFTDQKIYCKKDTK